MPDHAAMSLRVVLAVLSWCTAYVAFCGALIFGFGALPWVAHLIDSAPPTVVLAVVLPVSIALTLISAWRLAVWVFRAGIRLGDAVADRAIGHRWAAGLSSDPID